MNLTTIKIVLCGGSALIILIQYLINKRKSRQIADLTEQLNAKKQELMWEKNKTNSLQERSSQKYKLKNKTDEEIFNNWNSNNSNTN